MRQKLEGHGSPEYKLIWKHWVIPSELQICALRGSAHRTSDNGSGGWPLAGWPTVTARDYKDGACNVTRQRKGVNAMLGRMCLIFGMTTLQEHVQMENRGELNPEFCRWLMGFPKEVGRYAPTETL